MPLSHFKPAFAAMALCLAPCLVPSAEAATVSVQNYSALAYASALSSLGTHIAEGFEGAGRGEVTPGGALATTVGSFTTLGGKGAGDSVTGTGRNVAVRGGEVYGRTNTTVGGAQFLDSNDTWGISWVASTGALFDRLIFVLTDASDAGATLTISAGGVSTALTNLGNANRRIVSVFFDELVSSATILLTNTRGSSLFLNDGFGIDDVAVNMIQPASSVPAPVPLPAGLALLAGALAALAALRRRA